MAKEVAKKENGGGDLITAEMLQQMLDDAGAGVSTASEDNILPFVVLLQDMSPEVKKRDPEYVEGAEPGMYLNKATKTLYAGDEVTAKRTKLPRLEFQHCMLSKEIVEWVPREQGGGLVARHPIEGTVEDTMRKLGGKQGADPQNPAKWTTSRGTELLETRYHFGQILTGEVPQPAVIAFKSTGHTSSKQWNTLMGGFKVIDPATRKPMIINGQVRSMASWYRKYIIGSKPRENNKGSFYVTTVDDGGRIEDPGLLAAGKSLHEGAKAGIIKASTDEDAHGGGVSDEI